MLNSDRVKLLVAYAEAVAAIVKAVEADTTMCSSSKRENVDHHVKLLSPLLEELNPK